MVAIVTKEWIDGFWHVVASIETATGSRVGAHVVDLPEGATDAKIKAAILALYA